MEIFSCIKNESYGDLEKDKEEIILNMLAQFLDGYEKKEHWFQWKGNSF